MLSDFEYEYHLPDSKCFFTGTITYDDRLSLGLQLFLMRNDDGFVVGPNNYQKEVVCAQINMVHLALHWLIARYSWDFLEITPQLISRQDQLLAQP